MQKERQSVSASTRLPPYQQTTKGKAVERRRRKRSSHIGSEPRVTLFACPHESVPKKLVIKSPEIPYTSASQGLMIYASPLTAVSNDRLAGVIRPPTSDYGLCVRLHDAVCSQSPPDLLQHAGPHALAFPRRHLHIELAWSRSMNTANTAHILVHHTLEPERIDLLAQRIWSHLTERQVPSFNVTRTGTEGLVATHTYEGTDSTCRRALEFYGTLRCLPGVAVQCNSAVGPATLYDDDSTRTRRRRPQRLKVVYSKLPPPIPSAPSSRCRFRPPLRRRAEEPPVSPGKGLAPLSPWPAARPLRPPPSLPSTPRAPTATQTQTLAGSGPTA